MRPAIKVGNVVRYFDKQLQCHVEARVIEIEPFKSTWKNFLIYQGMYLYLDNDMCIHEDSVKVVI